MKFLEMDSLTKTNALLSRLRAFDPCRSLEVEAYTCKQTREQKRHRNIKKPLRFYISALEMAFPDHDFSISDALAPTNYSAIRDELAFVFFTLYKNSEDVEEFVSYFDALLEQCVNTKNAEFFTVNGVGESGFHRVFLIHGRREKRVLIIKSVLEIEACK